MAFQERGAELRGDLLGCRAPYPVGRRLGAGLRSSAGACRIEQPHEGQQQLASIDTDRLQSVVQQCLRARSMQQRVAGFAPRTQALAQAQQRKDLKAVLGAACTVRAVLGQRRDVVAGCCQFDACEQLMADQCAAALRGRQRQRLEVRQGVAAGSARQCSLEQ